MNKITTRTIIIAAAVSLLASFPLYSASIEEFQTEEYYGSGGLSLINAAEAYAKGYTGKGITIGINDLPARSILISAGRISLKQQGRMP